MFLKNRNFISKIRKSKVTDYAALIENKKEPMMCSLVYTYVVPMEKKSVFLGTKHKYMLYLINVSCLYIKSTYTSDL